jgi:formate/nitrite transporter FocA (FNT family)
MKKVLLNSILAGLAIALGGWAYLCITQKMDTNILASFIFSFGLILICNFNFNLYTGKVCYLLDDDKEKMHTRIVSLLLILLGNLIGTLIFSLLLRALSGNNLIYETLESITTTKLNYTWYETIIRAFFCGILVYTAVEGFRKIDNPVGKYIMLIMSIGIFIISGFEHSIANMFYYFLNLNFTFNALISILLCVIGNSIGGLFIPLIIKLINSKIIKC